MWRELTRSGRRMTGQLAGVLDVAPPEGGGRTRGLADRGAGVASVALSHWHPETNHARDLGDLVDHLMSAASATSEAAESSSTVWSIPVDSQSSSKPPSASTTTPADHDPQASGLPVGR